MHTHTHTHTCTHTHIHTSHRTTTTEWLLSANPTRALYATFCVINLPHHTAQAPTTVTNEPSVMCYCCVCLVFMLQNLYATFCVNNLPHHTAQVPTTVTSEPSMMCYCCVLLLCVFGFQFPCYKTASNLCLSCAGANNCNQWAFHDVLLLCVLGFHVTKPLPICVFLAQVPAVLANDTAINEKRWEYVRAHRVMCK